MCTITDAASQPQAAGAGNGRNGTAASANTPRARASEMFVRSLSGLDLSRAFQPACRTAEPSTAAITGREISIRAV